MIYSKILSITLALGALSTGIHDAHAGGYAAMAFSSLTSTWGEYHGANSQQEAVWGAYQACSARSIGCQNLAWVQNGYIVLMSNPYNQFFYGTGSDFTTATLNAQAVCGFNCTVRAWNFAYW